MQVRQARVIVIAPKTAEIGVDNDEELIRQLILSDGYSAFWGGKSGVNTITSFFFLIIIIVLN